MQRSSKSRGSYRTGVGGAFKATPLQVGDTLYVCLAGNIITALDVDTGEQRWRFDPKLKDSKVGFTTTCRGVTYYKAPAAAAECSERILTATTDARLIAVDAKTGKRCTDFGDNGEVSLLTGMGDVKPGFYYVTSPPTIARGVAVLGGWVADNVETGEPSGVIRGFDALTGAMVWAWDLGRTDVLTAPARRRHVHARHAERVERVQRRRSARARLHPDGQCDAGLLRRTSFAGIGKVRELRGRTRCRNRRAALVVPDDASRHLGLRRAVTAGARRHPR